MVAGDYKLKISSKKLLSGRFQINFSTGGFEEDYYGYMLAEAKTPVREVVEKIGRHLDALNQSDKYFQRNLFSLGKREPNSGRVLIFKRSIAHD
jgi:alkanesulfonate monooxygenase SsuD/methylene tetrahydromethanopterin reductase-like flavin-dependent oxidoreductase (luciferase family)